MPHLYKIYIYLFAAFVLISCSERREEQKKIIPEQTEIKEFLFVGRIKDEPGLYQYIIENKSVKPFWSNKNEKVVELSYSKNNKNSFFITAKDLGTSGAFPFIKGIKLYLVDLETGEVNFVNALGDGLQIFTQWENENNFRIIINSFDKEIVNYINHRRLLYNNFGKKLEDFSEIFDITTQGYPLPPAKELINISSDGKYSVVSEAAGVFLLDAEDETRQLMLNGSQKINQVDWRKNLVILSVNKEEPNLTGIDRIVIYSLKKKNILTAWEGSNLNNIYTAGDFILFDYGSGENSRIVIYSIKEKKLLDEIKIKGGCGLRNIAVKPDHKSF